MSVPVEPKHPASTASDAEGFGCQKNQVKSCHGQCLMYLGHFDAGTNTCHLNCLQSPFSFFDTAVHARLLTRDFLQSILTASRLVTTILPTQVVWQTHSTIPPSHHPAASTILNPSSDPDVFLLHKEFLYLSPIVPSTPLHSMASHPSSSWTCSATLPTFRYQLSPTSTIQRLR